MHARRPQRGNEAGSECDNRKEKCRERDHRGIISFQAIQERARRPPQSQAVLAQLPEERKRAGAPDQSNGDIPIRAGTRSGYKVAA